MPPSSPCPCYDMNTSSTILSLSDKSVPPLVITTSVFHISVKEIFILSLVLLLLVYSVVAFLKHWNKNYRDVNHFPHFSQSDSQLIQTGQITPNLNSILIL